MFDRVGIKEKSKSQIKDKTGHLALATFLLFLIVTVIGVVLTCLGKVFMPIIYLQYFITPPLTLGVLIYYLTTARENTKVEFGVNFDGFKTYWKSMGVNYAVALFTFLWSLLLIIPGIIKGLSYSQSMYILADNPNMGVMKSIETSKKMTEGHKMDIFVMALSFIGWCLLGSITLGIAYLWVFPYINTSYANMYISLKEEALQKGVCTQADFE